MFHRWAALGIVLALWAMTPKNAAGQGTTKSPRGPGAGAIGIPYPNPSNPEFHIPFTVGDSNCTDVGLQHVVTIQIKNVLAQTVAIPVLESAPLSGAVGQASSAGDTPVDRVRLGCGKYSAYWGGRMMGTTKEASSGTYLILILVDGKPGPETRRVFLRK
jgi:hypothetical protein